MSTTLVPSDRLRKARPAGCIAAILLVALCTGCTTELEGSWTSTRFDRPKFTSFVVMGVSRETTLRRVAEDAFVTQLAPRGIRAVPSYKIFPSDPEQLPREQVEQAVKQQAVQGAIVARVTKVEKETRSGGGGYYSPGDGFYSRYQRGWSGSYIRGGTTYQCDVVTVEVQLYDVTTGDLVWSGVTRTFDTSNLESSTTYWAKVVIQELVKRGIV